MSLSFPLSNKLLPFSITMTHTPSHKGKMHMKTHRNGWTREKHELLPAITIKSVQMSAINTLEHAHVLQTLFIRSRINTLCAFLRSCFTSSLGTSEETRRVSVCLLKQTFSTNSLQKWTEALYSVLVRGYYSSHYYWSHQMSEREAHIQILESGLFLFDLENNHLATP